MKKKEKRMILILVAITVIAIVALVIMRSGKKDDTTNAEAEAPKEEFVDVLEDGTRLNTSNKLHETKKFEGMEITNFQLTEKGNVTLLLGTITNKTETKQGGFPVDVKIVDKQGNELITVAAYMPPLEAGESSQLSTNATFDYANAYDFSISRRSN